MKVRALLILLLSAAGCYAQSPYNQTIYPAQSFTATAQTGAVIALNGATGTAGSSFGAGTITVTSPSLTTATFAVMGSSDNGATYYALPITPLTAGASPAATATATAAGLYQISLVGITHVKFVTSGTFTASVLTLTMTATPQVTVSRSSGAGGVVYASPTQTLAVAAATVTFSNIPQTYRHLKLVMSTSNSDGGLTSATIYIRFNGDSSFVYSTGVVSNGTPGATATANQLQIGVDFNSGGQGQIPGSTEVLISNYASTGWQKSMTSISAAFGSTTSIIQQCGGIWTSNNGNSPITQIQIFHGDGSNFVAGSSFTLLGI